MTELFLVVKVFLTCYNLTVSSVTNPNHVIS
nr:MAG TPA: hypothetical protein [Caudoviricetes sp.]